MRNALESRKRIMVIGSGGAGKSTFARRLSAITGLPLIHLDRHYWRPGWKRTPTEEWNAMVRELVARHEWIIDGNYTNSLPPRIRRCDAIVFFDFPRLLCLAGVIGRSLNGKARERPDAAPGCPERLDFEFLKWVWSYNDEVRPRVLEAIGAAPGSVETVTLRNRADVRRLLGAFGAVNTPNTP
jgi:adenylate kinase family enzyme